MKLCITEKPSVAKDIAQILGADVRRDGYFEGGEYKVTWTFGHLCTLKEPGDYEERWKRWALGVLPMIPARFGIKVIPDKGIEKQFQVIENLISEADEVINCGDAGQEGELIQRWVMQKASVNCPVKRLWISSLTDESIREGFARLQPESDFDNLYHAGLSRAIGDWILGMNATRLYSLKYSSPGNVLSIGRVQTPTLALIVQRHFEIENFKPEDYWELKTLYRGALFNATSGRFKSPEEAEAALEAIKSYPMVIKDVQKKKGREAPPRLFDLTSLQVECNKKWGWTADETLRLIQSLYEKKVTTYPRVDTTYLSEDIYPKVPGILRNMTPYATLTSSILADKLSKSKKVFDNTKVTDHHAIIPTGQSPSVLVGNERQLYHLIALRFIAAFYPDCKFLSTTVLGEVDKTGFKATGKVIEDAGWRIVYDNTQSNDDTKDDENSDDRILPDFTIGESGPHEPSLQKRTTQPPKYYTEGTLLRAMESAGKTVEDEELREAMKENGIGRPSTRAAIIETLFKRKYIYRNRKSIMASQAGIDLISTINEDLLKSAKLTGLWENKLRRIERGDYSASDFIQELKILINEIVINVLSDNSKSKIIVDNTSRGSDKSGGDDSDLKEGNSVKPTNPRAPRTTKFEQVECPICGKGHILKGKTAFGCSRFREGCSLRLSFIDYPESLTPAKLKKILKKK
ncbi:DNA topoisomerase 3 [uncultured Duncaniella sp.]|uniref:DNA topoisomerase 3 n=1 Tax=uncultured Duncaniella sp. TaxID=2768039 RepID=UPI0025A9CCB5|nr:DNA topoisomerase 3 [uncultured Duncaniella sp.]